MGLLPVVQPFRISWKDGIVNGLGQTLSRKRKYYKEEEEAKQSVFGAGKRLSPLPLLAWPMHTHGGGASFLLSTLSTPPLHNMHARAVCMGLIQTVRTGLQWLCTWVLSLCHTPHALSLSLAALCPALLGRFPLRGMGIFSSLSPFAFRPPPPHAPREGECMAGAGLQGSNVPHTHRRLRIRDGETW